MNADDVVAALDADGYAVVPDVLSAADVDHIRAELDPLIEEVPLGRNAFEGFHTRRLYAPLAKTRVLDPLVLDPLVEAVCDRVLGHHQLSATVGISIGPGEVAQVEHYDDLIYPMDRPHREVIVNTLWALDDFVPENGATVILPGSHKWAHKQPTAASKRRLVEMKAGSVVIYLGTVWHGGGANHTERPRLGVLLEYLASWLRSQENHVAGMSHEVVAALPDRLQDLLGWNVRPPFVGYFDGRDPKRLLHGGER